MKQLQGKIAVITGAGSGIGRALARGLGREKANLALSDLNLKSLEETKSILVKEGFGGTVKTYPLDVSNREQVEEFVRQVLADFGAVDLVVNNAGVSSSGGVRDLSIETLEWTININLWGVIYVTKSFLPFLLQRPEAGIVNISSVFGLMGVPGQTAYCASKFGVRGFSEALRQEYYQSNLTVTLVFPGGVKTNIARNSKSDYPISKEEYEQGVKEMEAAFQTTPEEAAQAIIEGVKNKAPRVLIGKDARRIDFLARFLPNTYDKTIAKYLSRKKAAARERETFMGH